MPQLMDKDQDTQYKYKNQHIQHDIIPFKRMALKASFLAQASAQRADFEQTRLQLRGLHEHIQADRAGREAEGAER